MGNPGSTHPRYNYMKVDWQMVSDLMGGTRAMHDAGGRWLPKYEKEAQADWQLRLDNAVLYPKFEQTVDYLVGLAFKNPLDFHDPPQPFEEWIENADLQGNHAHVFWRQVAIRAVADGITHVLTDFPPSEGIRDRGQELEAGLRPYWVHIDARNLMNWRPMVRGGRVIPGMISIRETVERPKDAWETQEVERRRVYLVEPQGVSVMLYEKVSEKEDNWEIVEPSRPIMGAGGKRLQEIPLTTIYTGYTGFMTAKLPLNNLAWANIQHWRDTSDQNNIVRVARVPMLFLSGFTPEEAKEIKVGSSAFNSAQDPNAKMQFVEHTGKAIEAGKQHIEAIEKRMDVMGMEPLVSRGGFKTATESVLSVDQATTGFGATILGIQDTIEQALVWWGVFAGIEPRQCGTVEIPSEFQGLKGGEDIAQLIAMWQAGAITLETMLQEAKRRDFFSDDVDPGEEIKRVQAQAPMPGAYLPGEADPNADPGAGA